MEWQRLLNDGNNCFDDKNWLQAEYFYKEAASYLDLLWSADSQNVELLTAWVSASHNLAALYELQGNSQISLHYLLIPHHRMLALSQSTEHSDDMRLIAMKALKITLVPIFLFSQKYSVCKDCQKALNDFQTQLDESQNTVH